MNICFCSDEKLVEMLPIVINSIASSNEKLITIHYIHCIKNKYKLEKLQKFVNKFKHLRLIFYYKSWDYQYKGLTHVTNATMLRLFIPPFSYISFPTIFELLIATNKVNLRNTN